MDDERLKNDGPVQAEQYFDEPLRRIQGIGLSERKLDQKIPSIYATAIGYDVTAQAPKDFFVIVQNEIHRAIHGLTAAQGLYPRVGAGQGNRGADCLGRRGQRHDAEIRCHRRQKLPERS